MPCDIRHPLKDKTILQRRAEVGHDDLTGQRAGLITGQEQQNVSHIFRLAGLDAQVHVLHHLAEHVLIQRCRIGLGHGGQDGGGVVKRIKKRSSEHKTAFLILYGS